VTDISAPGKQHAQTSAYDRMTIDFPLDVSVPNGAQQSDKSAQVASSADTSDVSTEDVTLSDVVFDADGHPIVPNILYDWRAWATFTRERDVNVPGPGHNLRNYWVRGKGAAKIRWNTNGDFTRCVKHLRKYVRDPQGLCAEYHRMATGKHPHPHPGRPTESGTTISLETTVSTAMTSDDTVAAKFNPGQLRGDDGRWIDTPGGGMLGKLFKKKQYPKPTSTPEGTADFPATNETKMWRSQRDRYSPQHWTPEERSTVKDYTRSAGSIDYHLRNPNALKDEESTKRAAAAVKTIDGMMKPSSENMTVFRTVNLDTLGKKNPLDLHNMVGKTMNVDGYTAAKLQRDSGSGANCADCITLNIRVPAGTNMLFVPSGDTFYHENQVMLPHGLKLRVLNVEPQSVTNPQRQVTVEVE